MWILPYCCTYVHMVNGIFQTWTVSCKGGVVVYSFLVPSVATAWLSCWDYICKLQLYHLTSLFFFGVTLVFMFLLSVSDHILFLFFLSSPTLKPQMVFSQVQRESMHMVQVTEGLVNDAINQYPELFRWVNLSWIDNCFSHRVRGNWDLRRKPTTFSIVFTTEI